MAALADMIHLVNSAFQNVKAFWAMLNPSSGSDLREEMILMANRRYDSVLIGPLAQCVESLFRLQPTHDKLPASQRPMP